MLTSGDHREWTLPRTPRCPATTFNGLSNAILRKMLPWVSLLSIVVAVVVVVSARAALRRADQWSKVKSLLARAGKECVRVRHFVCDDLPKRSAIIIITLITGGGREGAEALPGVVRDQRSATLTDFNFNPC